MIEIVPFDPSHLPTVLDLWKNSDGVSLGLADAPDQIEHYLLRNPGMSFVAFHDGLLVGAILGGHDGRRGYLHHLAVDGAHRRLGIARALVDRSLAALGSEGIERSHVFVRDDNETGRAFWAAHGWRQRDDLVMFSFTDIKTKSGE